jgi:DNA-binding transcriptional MocR family regulator
LKSSDKATRDAAIAAVGLDKGSAQPLHVQLTGQLRELILSGRIMPGERLPASRVLANELGVSRITVTTSMDQLVAEGYAEGRHGQGLFVVPDLPDKLLKAQGLEAGHVFEPLQRAARARCRFSRLHWTTGCFPMRNGRGCWNAAGANRGATASAS